ncbi:PaaI family thioesterase [Mycobacterium hodleri]|uniref:PaaI family thioesterase n=1 Tax=Mycolicibacterium hodleri TaxID=49897 RepID=A0A544VSI3_9MYCO|nr:PaaI family thioesterase [Mycolicibacterium hodleri]TQR82946.1 PaaI family thioesterase [Mycolicibacterium hodleri]
MSTDFPFDVVTAEEYERQQVVHGALTHAIRELIDAGIRTDVDDDTAHEARAAIEAVTAQLRGTQRATTSTLRHADTGRPLAWANPAVGLRNAIAPPMDIHHEAGGRCWSEFDLGLAYEGPPGLVHGGICALVLDHLLGEVASDGLTKPLFTGTITLRYLRGTPLGAVRAEAFVERTEGIKTYARGYLGDANGWTVEADGVFIMPAWARGAG